MYRLLSRLIFFLHESQDERGGEREYGVDELNVSKDIFPLYNSVSFNVVFFYYYFLHLPVSRLHKHVIHSV